MHASLAFLLALLFVSNLPAAVLQAGAAKVDITDERGPVNDRLYARALVLRSVDTTALLVTVDAVSFGEIGRLKNDFLPTVRVRLQKELGIPPGNTLFNASHCHGLVHPNVADRTVAAVREAMKNLVPVKAGAGVGRETRIMENRRLILKNGRTVDVRHAYSLPPDAQVAAVGPVDPEIGILRLDRLDGKPLAVVYNFACHPIANTPDCGNSADITGFSSKTIEDNFGGVALFVQGAGGDINPINYKALGHVRSAEPLGLMLGFSTLRAVRKIKCKPGQPLRVHTEKLTLPRADHTSRITEMEAERTKLANSLNGTFLNFDTFLPLAAKYSFSTNFPSLNSYRYLHEDKMGRKALSQLDTRNRNRMAAYTRNIHRMEQITRINTNLHLLKRHQANGFGKGLKTIDVEVAGLRVGEFVLTSFPGEITVPIGLNIKRESKHDFTFVAGYTNGYIYYAPTAKQAANAGGAQEDSDCLLAPAWQKIYEAKAGQLIEHLLK